MKEYLFTYGTLSNGHAPVSVSRVMRKLRPVGEGSIRARLYDLGEYPGAVPSLSNADRVRGRIFELPGDRKTLSDLDKYEEFFATDPAKSLFVRRKLAVRTEDGRRLHCWTYLYNHPPAASKVIKSGDYQRAKA